jgi:F420-dependent oxidoreductase-like protein
MVEVAIMIEGQDGLNWRRWQNLVRAVEELGFIGLYRSDHYTNAEPPDKDSLELWTSLTWLASHSQKIEFGPLVSPVSFRQPSMTARIASAIDDLSEGRLILGVGAGWQEREHTHFGWDLLSVPERFARFEEGLIILKHLLQEDSPLTFSGKYYRLQEAVLLPRPKRPGGPPILIGGNGVKLTLPLVARFASEWNAVYLPPDEITNRNQILDLLLLEQGRSPGEIRRSLMTGCVSGKDQSEVDLKVSRRTKGKRTADQLRSRGVIVGVGEEIKEQINHLADAGIQRVMLQWLDLDDLEGLEIMSRSLFH